MKVSQVRRHRPRTVAAIIGTLVLAALSPDPASRRVPSGSRTVAVTPAGRLTTSVSASRREIH